MAAAGCIWMPSPARGKAKATVKRQSPDLRHLRLVAWKSGSLAGRSSNQSPLSGAPDCGGDRLLLTAGR
jgi:hypothetical protein